MALQLDAKPLAEGKTKVIFPTAASHLVYIRSKDDITAGDGERRDVLEGKGEWSTTTTVNCFRLLEKYGVNTHLMDHTDSRTFRACLVEMIPVEIVIRRIGYGSFLMRNPLAVAGERFEDLVVEFFYKDDSRHDPMIVAQDGGLALYNPKRPISQQDAPMGFIEEETSAIIRKHAAKMEATGHETFTILERAWAAQDVVLVDLKIECGIYYNGWFMVADVIDNDSWRIWPGRSPENMLDKQVYRDAGEVTSEVLETLKRNYKEVAERTKRFIEI